MKASPGRSTGLRLTPPMPEWGSPLLKSRKNKQQLGVARAQGVVLHWLSRSESDGSLGSYDLSKSPQLTGFRCLKRRCNRETTEGMTRIPRLETFPWGKLGPATSPTDHLRNAHRAKKKKEPRQHAGPDRRWTSEFLDRLPSSQPRDVAAQRREQVPATFRLRPSPSVASKPTHFPLA